MVYKSNKPMVSMDSFGLVPNHQPVFNFFIFIGFDGHPVIPSIPGLHMSPPASSRRSTPPPAPGLARLARLARLAPRRRQSAWLPAWAAAPPRGPELELLRPGEFFGGISGGFSDFRVIYIVSMYLM